MKSGKLFKSFLTLTLTFCMGLPTALSATGNQPDLEKVDNLLAGAYQAIEQDNTGGAQQQFLDAAEQAKNIQDWQGLVDACYGLAALGQTEQALSFLQEAFRIARAKNSWQGLVAVGYALSSLPQNMNLLSQSSEAFDQAGRLAEKNQDWGGFVEAAKGFHTLKNSGKAQTLLDKAFALVEANEDAQGAMAVAKAFQSIGNSTKAAQAQALAQAISRNQGGEARGVKTPPPGWSPTGKSVRDANEVSEEAQRLNRNSVDKDISNKMTYIREKKRLDAEKERNRTRLAEAYLYYSGYYRYPGSYFGIRNFGLYGFGAHRLSRSHLHSFARFHLSSYSRRGGFYIRVNRSRYYH